MSGPPPMTNTGLPAAQHHALTKVELLALKQACEECRCDFDCYCGRNLEWAERKLAELNQPEPPHD